MATQVTVARNSQAGALGHEDYSLYSSMSEDELIQLAIEQSLTEDPAEQTTTQKTTTPTHNDPNCHNFYLYPWQSSASCKHCPQLRWETRARTNTRNMLLISRCSKSEPCFIFLSFAGADINTQASDKASALFEACKNGHDEIVEFLLSQGADANKTNKNGLLPIHVASKRGYYEIVKMLLPVTSRTRTKRSGISPLHLAAECNRDDVLEELVEAGFDVNFTLSPERSRLYEDRRTTVLYFSVFNNNVEAAQLLLEAGANPNVDLINPLLISIRHGCMKMMKLLIDYGANIDAYVASHPTTFPATIMFSMKYLALLKFLMDLGCDAISCFKCQYGCGPHPPIEAKRDRYHDPQVNKEQSIVQFCEMVSTPEMCRWAGPIIDVLLDYVGNVQLCSRLKEHIDSYEDWANIKYKAEPPRPLAHLCRIKIRSLIGKSRISLIDTLPLPGRLMRYLQYDYTR
ncbi:ankyrin repeat and SOCS box protein 2 [Lacerta agilis]|uniref:ankyrin repeat and SOCS box protein 2 n=1 Tax=Lacerta agilis TaxID=80427 RepID=UPI00141A52D7|nr:ankyrin repeat and SOCS box protein 2 [Lacerta agilis]